MELDMENWFDPKNFTPHFLVELMLMLQLKYDRLCAESFVDAEYALCPFLSLQII